MIFLPAICLLSDKGGKAGNVLNQQGGTGNPQKLHRSLWCDILFKPFAQVNAENK
jgi:hypothetical protein